MKKLWATLVFWFWVLLGPMALGLLLKICWGMLGGDQEDLYRNVQNLVFFVQPWACIMAYYSVVKITNEPGGYCTRYNCLVGVIVVAGLTVSDMLGGFFLRAASLGTSCVILVICLNNTIQDYRNTAKNEAQKPEEEAPKEAASTAKAAVKTVPAWTLWVCIGVFLVAAVLVAGGYIPGIQRTGNGTDTAEQIDDYGRGYDAGVEYQKNHDLQELTIDGVDIRWIADQVSQVYGMQPAKAYTIVCGYSEKPNHDGYTFERYQEALEAILYTVSLFPFR